MDDKEIYKPPESDLTDKNNQENLEYKLYKISGIGLASFLGTVFAGGILMAKNYNRLGERQKAKKSLIISGIVTPIIMIVSLLIPEDVNIPNSLFTIPQLLIMVDIAKRGQSVNIDAHIAQGGELESNWKAAGISLLVLVGVIIVFVPIVMIMV